MAQGFQGTRGNESALFGLPVANQPAKAVCGSGRVISFGFWKGNSA